MSFFGKKKNIEVSDYSGRIKKRRDSLLTSFDKMEYFIVTENSEEELLKICDTIIGGKAVLANFDKLNSYDANEMLSFISGVIYAKDGEIIKQDNKVFLFGRKEEFEDGSLYQYIEDTK